MAIKDTLKRLLTPRQSFFMFRDLRLRNFLIAMDHGLRFPFFLSRKCATSRYLNQVQDRTMEITRKNGFAVFTPDALPASIRDLARQAREEALRLYEANRDSDQWNRRKPYLQTLFITSHLLNGSDDLNRESPIVKLALSPPVLSAVSAYLGVLPLLFRVQLWYSPNDRDYSVTDSTSQSLHLDPEDKRMVRVLIFLKDVTPDSGPLTLMPAEASRIVTRALKYNYRSVHRVPDEKALQILGKDARITLTGPTGTMAMFDTANCLHYGSRAGTKPRYILQFLFLSPYTFVIPWFRGRAGAQFPMNHSKLSPFERKLFQ